MKIEGFEVKNIEKTEDGHLLITVIDFLHDNKEKKIVITDIVEVRRLLNQA